MKTKLTKRSVAPLKPRKATYDVRDTDIKGFLIRVRPTGFMTYLLQYRNELGRQTHYKIGVVGNLTPAQARDIAEKKAAEAASGKDIQIERKELRAKGERDRFNTLGGFIEHKYSPWVQQHLKGSQKTLDRIKLHFDFLYGRSLSDVNAWVIEKWRSQRLKQGVSKVTVNRDISDLKAALSKAVDWKVIDTHPLIDVKPLKVDKIGKVRFLSDTEEKRLRKTLDLRDRKIKKDRASANKWRRERGYDELSDLRDSTYGDHLTPIVLLSLNTGLRRGELFNLKWEDINLRSKVLSVLGEGAKSGMTRHLPLNQESLNVIKKWKDQRASSDLVFPGRAGKQLTEIKTAWRPLILNAKIKDFRFHDLRHSFASKLVMKGAPLNTVRELLGHGDLKTTLRYAHLAPDHKADAVALLNS